MKKLLISLIVVLMVMAVSIPAFAQPVVPEQSIGNVNANAHHGLHIAHHNMMEAKGNAAHVFEVRFMPVFHE